MDNHSIVTLVGIGTFGAAFIITVVTIGRVYLRRSAPSHQHDARLDAIEQRLAELQRGVDATAIEVERVSEGQRFTTKLLADRLERVGLLGRSERIITPH